jgi:hypothetical protein
MSNIKTLQSVKQAQASVAAVDGAGTDGASDQKIAAPKKKKKWSWKESLGNVLGSSSSSSAPSADEKLENIRKTTEETGEERARYTHSFSLFHHSRLLASLSLSFSLSPVFLSTNTSHTRC